MSGGRLDWGIGAGWYENEYRSYGYEFPKPKDRIGMLRFEFDGGFELDCPVRPACEVGDAVARIDLREDFIAGALEIDIETFQNACGDTFAFTEQT